jgi:hypothetical protein
MTTIRWKNGGPLLLQPVPNYEYGLVAANQQCCCPPPPPPPPLRCFCPGGCSYFIEVLAPEGVSAKTPVFKCNDLVASNSAFSTQAFLYPQLVPGTPLLQGYQVVALNGGGTSSLRNDLIAYAYAVITSDVDGQVCGNFPQISVAVECYAFIDCNELDGGTRGYRIRIEGAVRSTVNGVVGPDDCYAAWKWTFIAEHDLSSSCVSAPKKWCGPAYDLLNILETPLDITVTGTGSSVGAFNVQNLVVEEAPENDSFPLAKSVGEAIRDAFSYTFRITSRQSCQSATCSCSAAAGTEWTFSNGTRSKTFVWGTDDVEWGGSPYYWSWDGVGYLVLEIFDPDTYVTGIGGLVLERHTVQISCDTVDDISTWLASVTSQCLQYDNVPQITHDSIDEWAGSLDCVPGCEDEHRAAGDPVLDGELVDVEYLGRSTAVGTTECSPPARLSISVKQIATC